MAEAGNTEGIRALRGAEKRRLRSRAQLLEPAISIGKSGVTAGTLKTLATIFKKTDLAKIRFAEGRAAMKAQIAEIEAGTATVCVGAVGRTAAFFNPNFVPENASRGNGKNFSQ